jgi:histidine ammonia-lyase
MQVASQTQAIRDHYSCHDVFILSQKPVTLALSSLQKERIKECRAYLEAKLTEPNVVFYGINTGFGALCNTLIEHDQLEELQANLVRSHATGMGDEVPTEIVRIMLLLKVMSLHSGYSGVRLDVVEKLLYFYNQGLNPVVYQLGSLGASGDLAPLAHITLTLIGEGEIRDAEGNKYTAAAILQQRKINPLTLQSKEGLALLNGTQFMSAYGVWIVAHSNRIWAWAQAIAALSCEAYLVADAPFNASIHAIRPHPGQIASANGIRKWREASMLSGTSGRVQDPYSFRCIPQVHGASLDTIEHANRVIEIEINATTDNPNIFPAEDLIVSGGNFHGQPLALVLDFLAIALAELGSISERRTYLLLAGANQTNPFLAQKPGLESGLMIAQYTAASIVSANKQLCTPASVDSISSSNGQEDHVSMGANAATKCYRVVENIYRILAVEYLTAYTALTEERRQLVSPSLKALLNKMENEIRPGLGDRYLSPELQRIENYLRQTEPPMPIA